MLPLARYAPETSALQVRPLSPEQGALLRGAATSSITKAQDTEKVISLTAHPIAEPVRLLPIVAPALESNALLDPEVFDEDSSNAMPVKVDSNFIQAVRDEEDDDAKDLKRPPIIDEIEEQEAQEEQEHYGLDIDESQNDIMLQPIEETPI